MSHKALNRRKSVMDMDAKRPRAENDAGHSDLPEKRLKSVEISTNSVRPTDLPTDDEPVLPDTTKNAGRKFAEGKGRGGKKSRGGDWKGKEKDNWKGKRDRRGERPRPKEGEEGYVPPADGADKAERLAKRKVALLLGFCGAGYNGMQMYASSLLSLSCSLSCY